MHNNMFNNIKCCSGKVPHSCILSGEPKAAKVKPYI